MGAGEGCHTCAVVSRRPQLRLRTRVTVFFALIALVASFGLSVATYVFARNYLINERGTSARQQATTNADSANIALTDRGTVTDWFESRLRTEPGGFALISDPVLTTNLRVQLSDLPDEMRAAAEAGMSGTQRFQLQGDPYYGVAVHLPEHDTTYFEAFPFDDADRTLRAIRTVLALGSVGTTALVTFFGWTTAHRLLRPVSRVADAAEEFGEGHFETRMDPEHDPDLDRLVDAFNGMADSVQARIEREARFASDVSHELRSPITALSAAVEVLHGRRGELPDRTQQAVDVVVNQVRRFDAMVIDLLELSRLDAGTTDLLLEELDLASLTDLVATRLGFVDVPIEVDGAVSTRVTIDKIRYDRIMSNLLMNADIHGGGPVRVSIEPARSSQHLLVAVEDAGPGVAIGERTRIFERFSRGSAARHRVGTGLGLALVSEHAQALDGQAWVEDRPGGGARFVVQLKVDHP